MNITSFVIGIISILLSVIPFLNFLGIVPAIVGFIVGLTDITYRKKNKTKQRKLSIAGVVLNVIAILLTVFWSVLIAGSL